MLQQCKQIKFQNYILRGLIFAPDWLILLRNKPFSGWVADVSYYAYFLVRIEKGSGIKSALP
jgi:hypothetical protein